MVALAARDLHLHHRLVLRETGKSYRDTEKNHWENHWETGKINWYTGREGKCAPCTCFLRCAPTPRPCPLGNGENQQDRGRNHWETGKFSKKQGEITKIQGKLPGIQAGRAQRSCCLWVGAGPTHHLQQVPTSGWKYLPNTWTCNSHGWKCIPTHGKSSPGAPSSPLDPHHRLCAQIFQGQS